MEKNEQIEADKKSFKQPKKTNGFYNRINLHKMLLALACIFSILALAGTAMVWCELKSWRNTTLKNRSLSEQASEQKFDEINKNLKNIYTQRALDNTEITQIKTTLEEFKQAQLKQIPNPNDLIVQSVIQLLQQANLELQFNFSAPSAINLLQAADNQLSQANKSEFTALRQAIANNILALKSTPSVDLETLLLRFTALNSAINNLPQFSRTATSSAKVDSSNAKREPYWHYALQQIIQNLKPLFVIRHSDEPISPLPIPELRAMLLQNLQLLLQQAQWAAIHHDIKVYRLSLQQTIDLIKKLYASNPQAVQSQITELTALLALPVNPALTNINSTLEIALKLSNQGSATS